MDGVIFPMRFVYWENYRYLPGLWPWVVGFVDVAVFYNKLTTNDLTLYRNVPVVSNFHNSIPVFRKKQKIETQKACECRDKLY